MSNALDGVRILDLTRLLPGAVCTLLLADMGADVIKVEDPGTGDYARWMPPLIDGLGAFFRVSNRNKRSMIINLKAESGQRVLHRLVEKADVIIEGFRPGVTKRLRADYETLKAINPRLVYCSLSGWGQDGPYAQKSAHDLNYLALAGVQGSTRTPQPFGGQIADVGGAYVGVMGILAALFKRERTGTGDWVDAALSESAMPFSMVQFVESLAAGLPGGGGTLTGLLACYDVYWSQDKEPMTLAALEPKFWANFCNAMEHPEWIEEHQQIHKQDALRKKIQAVFVQKTADDWDDLLRDAECCFTLVTPPANIIHDPQIKARGMAGVSEGGIPWMRSPVRLTGDTFQMGAVPDFGEHTGQVLAEAGYTPDEIAALHKAGAVGRPEVTAD